MIYRSTASPYGGFEVWATAESSPTVVAVTAEETAYYYLATDAACSQGVIESERLGLFDFSLIPGD